MIHFSIIRKPDRRGAIPNGHRPTGPRRPFRRRRVWPRREVLLFVLALFHGLLGAGVGLDTDRWGATVDAGWRVLHGQVPGRDFAAVPSAGPHALALLFCILGESDQVARLGLVLLQALLALLIYRCARGVLSPRAALVPWTFAVLAGGPLSSTPHLLAVVLVLWASVEHLESRLELGPASLAAGASWLVSFDPGLLATLLLFLPSVFLRARRRCLPVLGQLRSLGVALAVPLCFTATLSLLLLASARPYSWAEAVQPSAWFERSHIHRDVLDRLRDAPYRSITSVPHLALVDYIQARSGLQLGGQPNILWRIFSAPSQERRWTLAFEVVLALLSAATLLIASVWIAVLRRIDLAPHLAMAMVLASLFLLTHETSYLGQLLPWVAFLATLTYLHIEEGMSLRLTRGWARVGRDVLRLGMAGVLAFVTAGSLGLETREFGSSLASLRSPGVPLGHGRSNARITPARREEIHQILQIVEPAPGDILSIPGGSMFNFLLSRPVPWCYSLLPETHPRLPWPLSAVPAVSRCLDFDALAATREAQLLKRILTRPVRFVLVPRGGEEREAASTFARAQPILHRYLTRKAVPLHTTRSHALYEIDPGGLRRWLCRTGGGRHPVPPSGTDHHA